MSKVIRFVYKALHKISPTLGGIVSAWYSTISGWRFDDLKKFFRSEIANGAVLPILARMQTLDCIRNDLRRSARIAFISPMPPEDTGIASYSFHSFREAKEAIDIFCRPLSDDAFFLVARRLGSSIRLLDAGLLMYANDLIAYKAIIFSLGNSHHHYYLWDIFNRVGFFGMVDRCVIYIHDPYLNNFIQSGLSLSNHDYIQMISKAYGLNDDIVANLMSSGAKWQLHTALHKLGITGVKLLTQLGFKKFLVNSQRARSILEKDIGNQVIEIKKIFLPIFEPLAFSHEPLTTPIVDTSEDSKKDLILVGTFGVPGNSKRTDLVIDAICQLQSRGFNIQLIVAGFGVNDYFKSNPTINDDFIIKIESPSDAHLYQLMHKVDIAVQLRLNDTGESSGIIPQLLMARKRTVVSPIGSFQEYGDLVEYLKEATPTALSELIKDFLSRPVNAAAIEAYCQERSPVEFRRLLLQYYS